MLDVGSVLVVCQKLQSFHYSLSSQDELILLLNAEPSWEQSNFIENSNIRNSTLKSQVGSESWGGRCESTEACVSIISRARMFPPRWWVSISSTVFPHHQQQLKVALNILLHSWSLVILLLAATMKWMLVHTDKCILSLGGRCWMSSACVVSFDI